MARSPFGWSYPPGAAGDPNAPYNQSDSPCDVCHLAADDCICPECKVCHEIGRKECYDDFVGRIRSHGLCLSHAQEISRAEFDVAEARQNLQDAEMVLHQLKEYD